MRRRRDWMKNPLMIAGTCCLALILLLLAGAGAKSEGQGGRTPVRAPAPASLQCPPDLKDTVSTTTGCVQGALSHDGTRQMFLGIPYAKPPVRFTLAEAPDPWLTPLRAEKFGPACIQYPQI